MTPRDILDAPSEPTITDTVESWRLHQLIEAGYPIELAEQLAASDADLHRACELLTNGCNPDTAVRILT